MLNMLFLILIDCFQPSSKKYFEDFCTTLEGPEVELMQQIFNERSVLFLGCDPERPEYKNFFQKFAVNAKVDSSWNLQEFEVVFFFTYPACLLCLLFPSKSICLSLCSVLSTVETLQVWVLPGVRPSWKWKSPNVKGKHTTLGIRAVLEYRNYPRRNTTRTGNINWIPLMKKSLQEA